MTRKEGEEEQQEEKEEAEKEKHDSDILITGITIFLPKVGVAFTSSKS